MAPSTSADEQLVLDIVKFLTVVVTRCAAGTMSDNDSSAVNDTFSWIGEMLLNNSGALYHLLNKADLSAESTDGKSSATRYKHYINYSKTTKITYCFIDVSASRRKPSSGLTSGAGR